MAAETPPLVSTLRPAAAWFRPKMRKAGLFLANLLCRKGSIVGETLALQMIFAVVLGMVAIGGLWAISQTVIQDNMRKWAQSWITDLEELGAPLYNSEDNERFLRVENYIDNFKEIVLVRYYRPDGVVLFEGTARGNETQSDSPLLSPEQMDRLRKTIDTDTPYLFDPSTDRGSGYLVRAPVWIESMNPGALLDLELDKAGEVKVLGYVELGLDFSIYQDRLVNSIAIGSAVFAVALLLLMLGERRLLKGALKPLSDLEIPLSRLAAGETEVNVEVTGHKEIIAINKALETTISSLNERDRMLRRLADYDSLTGLPNRRYFKRALEAEIEWVGKHDNTSALLFLDLDQFKYVNDSMGHTVGDRLLVQVAGTLRESLRKNDHIARFGGDEFTILLKNLDQKDTIRIMEHLMRVMQDFQCIVEDQSLSVLCSIGATMIDSDQYSPDELMSQADLACREAKACGRNKYKFYELSEDEKNLITADMGWSQKIKDALKDDALFLQYQPILDLREGHTSMYEVLVRMRGGDALKTIPPTAFLPAANRFGLMVDIDHFVIRKSMQALAAFRAKGDDVKFTLNLSGYIFNDSNLVSIIRENLEMRGLDPGMIIFEVTEQVAVRHLKQARSLIQELMELGCHFALDDFGSGFSSFNYLKSLPVEYIKIDGGFIKNMANDLVDQTMVKSIIQIAKAVGKKTIAEYVQDEETLKILGDLGVDYAQGFYIGPPADNLLD